MGVSLGGGIELCDEFGPEPTSLLFFFFVFFSFDALGVDSAADGEERFACGIWGIGTGLSLGISAAGAAVASALKETLLFFLDEAPGVGLISVGGATALFLLEMGTLGGGTGVNLVADGGGAASLS